MSSSYDDMTVEQLLALRESMELDYCKAVLAINTVLERREAEEAAKQPKSRLPAQKLILG